MVAGHMTKTNNIGILAAFEWQPEVEGFYQGVSQIDKGINVQIQYVGNWDNDNKALALLEKMIANKTDVVYPVRRWV